MNLENFYTFNASFSQAPVCVESDMITWDTSLELIKGIYSSVKLPLVVKQTTGKKWTDLLNPVGEFKVISKRFADLLSQNNVTGWQVYPIILLDKEYKEVSDYMGFSIVGRCGAVDYTKTEVYEKQLVPDGPKSRYYKGLHVGLDKWDGSDFFIPEATLHIIITGKVMQIIKKHKITNVVLQSLAEYEIAEFALPKR